MGDIEHAPSDWTCPNGHEFPAVVPVGCPECNALVICEPVSAGMALSEQLRGAVGALAEIDAYVGRCLDGGRHVALEHIRALARVALPPTGGQ